MSGCQYYRDGACVALIKFGASVERVSTMADVLMGSTQPIEVDDPRLRELSSMMREIRREVVKMFSLESNDGQRP